MFCVVVCGYIISIIETKQFSKLAFLVLGIFSFRFYISEQLLLQTWVVLPVIFLYQKTTYSYGVEGVQIFV